MNTPEPLDPRNLAHRLTAVGGALHHRLLTQLRDDDLHPKTVLLLSVIDGRIDAPWVTDRLARGGKRINALADRGWITRTDDAWTLTDEGRAVLDRVDAERQELLADVPAEELQRLVAALDAISAALGLDTEDPSFGPGGPFGPGAPGRRPGPFGPRFGFGPRGPWFGPGRGEDSGEDEPRRHRGGTPGNAHHGFGPRHGGHVDGQRGDGVDGTRGRHAGERGEAGRGCRPGSRDGGRAGEHGHGHGASERGHRAAQRAYERGFEAGFGRGRASAASA